MSAVLRTVLSRRVLPPNIFATTHKPFLRTRAQLNDYEARLGVIRREGERKEKQAWAAAARDGRAHTAFLANRVAIADHLDIHIAHSRSSTLVI